MPNTQPAAAIENDLALATAPLVTAIGESIFFEQLAIFLRSRAHSDSLVVLLYDRNYPPRVVHDDLDPLDGEALYSRYFMGAYLLSPFYQCWLAAPAGSALHRLKDIAPDGFFDSVYFTDYYGRSGLADEMGYVVPTNTDSAILVSLGRTARLPAYSPEERQRLQAVEPVVSSTVRRHSALVSSAPHTPLNKWLADALVWFGTTVLTAREQNVVQLMLRGHSSKSCARELEISPTTERVHRRNIYAKLGISSQAELFSLFVECLATNNLEAGKDPLAQMYKPRD